MHPPRMRFFVHYPRGVETGGPLALHQLVDSLRRQDADAWLVPFRDTLDSVRSHRYAYLDAPELPTDAEPPTVNDVGVFSEFHADAALQFPGTPIVWWLSVDNSPLFAWERHLANTRYYGRTIDRAREMRLRLRSHKAWKSYGRVLQDARIQHVAQSVYAKSYLRVNHGVQANILSDVTEASHDAERVEAPLRATGEGFVSYNPARGTSAVERMRAWCDLDGTEWVPLRGMSRGEVDRQLLQSSLYVDLGHQPGKDRLAREAALRGNVCIVAGIGAGAFFEDLALPEMFRVDPRGKLVDRATEVFNAARRNLAAYFAEQEGFRAAIAREEAVFDGEVSDLMRRLARVLG